MDHWFSTNPTYLHPYYSDHVDRFTLALAPFKLQPLLRKSIENTFVGAQVDKEKDIVKLHKIFTTHHCLGKTNDELLTITGAFPLKIRPSLP